MPTHRCCLRTSGLEATQRAAQQLELAPSASGEVGTQLLCPSSHTCSSSADCVPLHGQNGPPPLLPSPSAPVQSLFRDSHCPLPHSTSPGPGLCNGNSLPCHLPLALPPWQPLSTQQPERPVDQTFLLMVPLCFKPSQHQCNTTLAQVSTAWSTPDSPATLDGR